MTHVGGAWDDFARANDAPELVAPAPLGRSVFDATADDLTRHAYERLLQKVVRTGLPSEFSVRCDSSTHRRLLRLTMRPHGRDHVGIRAIPVEVVARAAPPLLDRFVARADHLVRGCAWCGRFAVGGGWVEVEDAVRMGGLFTYDGMPTVSHGMCPACERRVELVLGEA